MRSAAIRLSSPTAGPDAEATTAEELLQFLAAFQRSLTELTAGLERSDRSAVNAALQVMTAQDLGARLTAVFSLSAPGALEQLRHPLKAIEADLTRASALVTSASPPGLGVFVPSKLMVVRAVLGHIQKKTGVATTIAQPGAQSSAAPPPAFPAHGKSAVAQTGTAETVTLVVDYSLPLSKQVEAGTYDFVDNLVFKPTGPRNVPVDVLPDTGTRQVALVLVRLPGSPTSRDALEALRRRKLRPATLAELLALGAQHPQKQIDASVVELGVVWNFAGDLRVACLNASEGRRGLALLSYDFREWPGEWPGEKWCVAAVPEAIQDPTAQARESQRRGTEQPLLRTLEEISRPKAWWRFW